MKWKCVHSAGFNVHECAQYNWIHRWTIWFDIGKVSGSKSLSIILKLFRTSTAIRSWRKYSKEHFDPVRHTHYRIKETLHSCSNRGAHIREPNLLQHHTNLLFVCKCVAVLCIMYLVTPCIVLSPFHSELSVCSNLSNVLMTMQEHINLPINSYESQLLLLCGRKKSVYTTLSM